MSQCPGGVDGLRELCRSRVIMNDETIQRRTYSRAWIAMRHHVTPSLTASHIILITLHSTAPSNTLAWPSCQYKAKAMFSSCQETLVSLSSVGGLRGADILDKGPELEKN